MSDSSSKAATSRLASLGALIRRQPELLLAVGLISILLVILVPLPPAVVDPLLIFNVTLSLLILMTAAAISRALEFSVFPSLLLIATFFRIALNIATTRLIIGNASVGPEAAGQVVETFGRFVGGDNLIVGMVVFTVIVVVQFVVITKGASRVSEVAARFQLDAMPGKQLSIDSDLGAGLIDAEEARSRRARVGEEADFYGAMDGASKFVRGDAVAGVLIMFVNLVGGAIAGVFWHRMDLGTSLATFGRLTIGDGLVSQVPALMISVASALLVTRSSTGVRLGSDIGRQLLSNDRVLMVTAVFLVLLTPTGLPVPALALSAMACATCAWVLRRERLAREASGAGGEVRERTTRMKAREEESGRPSVDAQALLRVECLELEIGYRLVSFVGEDGDLLEYLAALRRRIALELGLVVPSIRVADSRDLRGAQYSLKLRGTRLGTWSARPRGFLAMAPASCDDFERAFSFAKAREHEATRLQLGAREALWISEDEADSATEAGLELFRPAAAIAQHVDSLIRTHAADVLGRDDVVRRIEDLRARAPGLVSELVPDVVSTSVLHRVLQGLLREGVAVRDLETILEAVSEAPASESIERVVEGVRRAFARAISSERLASDGRLHAILLESAMEEFLVASIEPTSRGDVLALDPRTVDSIVIRAVGALRSLVRGGFLPSVVCSPAVRVHFWRLLRRKLPGVAVLSYDEIPEDIAVDVHDTIGLDRLRGDRGLRRDEKPGKEPKSSPDPIASRQILGPGVERSPSRPSSAGYRASESPTGTAEPEKKSIADELIPEALRGRRAVGDRREVATRPAESHSRPRDARTEQAEECPGPAPGQEVIRSHE